MSRPRGLEETFYNGIMFSVSATWFRRDTILITLDFRFNDLSPYFLELGRGRASVHHGKDANYYKAMIYLLLSTLSKDTITHRDRCLFHFIHERIDSIFRLFNLTSKIQRNLNIPHDDAPS
jgi:hypothetical protein